MWLERDTCGRPHRTYVEHYVIVNPEGCGRDLLAEASSRVSRVFDRSAGQNLTNRAAHPSRCCHLPRTTVRSTFFDFIWASLAASWKWNEVRYSTNSTRYWKMNVQGTSNSDVCLLGVTNVLIYPKNNGCHLNVFFWYSHSSGEHSFILCHATLSTVKRECKWMARSGRTCVKLA